MKNFLKHLHKTLSQIILIFFTLLVSINPLNAQPVNEIVLDPEAPESEQVDKAPEIEDSPELKVDFKQHTQDPETKIIKFEITVTPNFTSDRVRIDWSISGTSKAVDESTLTIARTTLRSGVPQSFSIEVIPTRLGISEVLAKVTAVKVDGSIISTARKNYVTTDDKEVLPITDEYRQRQITNLITRIIIYIFVAIVVLFGGFFGLRWFIRWLNKFDKNV